MTPIDSKLIAELRENLKRDAELAAEINEPGAYSIYSAQVAMPKLGALLDALEAERAEVERVTTIMNDLIRQKHNQPTEGKRDE